MEQITCRTCLTTITDKKKCMEITRTCFLQKTAKDVIIMLVPEMVSTLIENDHICSKCFHTLKASMKFIARCLEVEMLNAEKKEALKDQNDVDDYVENGVKGVNKFQTFTLDHNYDIKVEPKDSEDLIIESKAQNVNNSPENYIEPIEIFEFPYVNDEERDPLENVFQESESYNIVEDKNNIIFVNSDLLTCKEDPDSENSQPTITSPPETDNFSCTTCSEKFTCHSDYDLHLDIHPPFICPICGKGFKTNDAYKRHVRFHNRSTVCEICGKCLKEPSALSLHINTVHRKESRYMCDKCPKRFKTNDQLRVHIKAIHNGAKEHQCQVCGKLFTKMYTCKSHYRLVHLKLKPFVCEKCGKEFGRRNYLRDHMKCHTRERKRVPRFGIRLNSGEPVDCKVCGKRISNINNLKAHLQTHVKMGRYKCKYCDLTFAFTSTQVRHERVHEQDPENKFRCDICWKRMKTKEELKKHVEAHYKLKPPQHSCDVCGEKFHRKYLLDNHQLNEHMGPEDIKKAEQEMINTFLQHADPNP